MSSYMDHTVEAGGCRTHYVEAGSGETLLLLHSMDPGGSGSLEYRENIEALSQHFRVIAPDLIGFSGTPLPNRPLGDINDEFTNHIVALMDALGLQKVHLAGNSRGGLISIAIAASLPERVGRIVLLANAGGGVTKEYLEKVQAQFANFRPTRDQMRNFLADSYYAIDRHMSDQVFDEYCRNAVAQYEGYDAIGGIRNDVADLRPLLAKAKHPILYIFGANDKRWPPTHDGVDVYLKTPGARYYNIANCGHHPQTEAADEVNLLMTAFFKGQIAP